MKSCCTPSRAGLPAVASLVMRSQAGGRSEDMARLPGGVFLMGSEAADAYAEDGEGPVRAVRLPAFCIDTTAVTTAAFAHFVADTGYVTDAEVLGYSFVFQGRPRDEEGLSNRVWSAPWWAEVAAADWRRPQGPEGSDAAADHPVVQVSWNDAVAYAAWSGGRLPSEAEWEYAARGGLTQATYPWGDELEPEGLRQANLWCGPFPERDPEAAPAGTCPVRTHPPNGFGLYETSGNVWEWCADWFSPDHHLFTSRDDPRGPPSGERRVLRGGSHLCHASYCNRYRVSARSSSTPQSATSHIGFRCAGPPVG